MIFRIQSLCLVSLITFQFINLLTLLNHILSIVDICKLLQGKTYENVVEYLKNRFSESTSTVSRCRCAESYQRCQTSSDLSEGTENARYISTAANGSPGATLIDR